MRPSTFGRSKAGSIRAGLSERDRKASKGCSTSAKPMPSLRRSRRRLSLRRRNPITLKPLLGRSCLAGVFLLRAHERETGNCPKNDGWRPSPDGQIRESNQSSGDRNCPCFSPFTDSQYHFALATTSPVRVREIQPFLGLSASQPSPSA